MRHNIRDSKGRFTKTRKPEKVYMRGFKGFRKGLICRGKQYKENTVFEEPEAEMCKKGMHFCKNPLDVLNYYSPDKSEYCEVEALSNCKTFQDKSVTTKLKVKEKLSLKQMLDKAAQYLRKHFPERLISSFKSVVVAEGAGNIAEARSDSDSVAMTLGHYSIASVKHQASVAISVNPSSVAIAHQNYSSAVSLRACSAAQTHGEWSAAVAHGNASRAECVDKLSAAVSMGRSSEAICKMRGSVAVCTGSHSSAEAARGSVAVSTACYSKVKGALGSYIVSIESDTFGQVSSIAGGLVDGKKIKPDTWYMAKDGKLVEA